MIAYALMALFGGMVLAAYVWAAHTQKQAPLVSAYTVLLGLFAIYLLLPGMMLLVIRGGEYVWLTNLGGYGSVALTTFVCTLALGLMLVGYRIGRQTARAVPAIATVRRPGLLAFQVAWAMVAAGLLIKFYVLIAGGGLETTLMRMSAGTRQVLKMDDAPSGLNMLRYMSSIADAGATWLLLQRMQARRRILPIAVLFIVVLGASFFGSGKRLYILWPLVAAILGVHYYVRPLRIKLRLLPMVAGVTLGTGFLSLMFRVFLPAQSASSEIDLHQVAWADGSIFNFYFFSLEFASFEALTLAVQKSDEVIRLFGDRLIAFYVTNVEPLSLFIPRSIYPGKPDVLIDLSHAYRALIVGGGLTDGGGVAGTLIATSWTIAGPTGLILAMVALGYGAGNLDKRFLMRGLLTPLGIASYSFGIVALFHIFRQGTFGWVVIITISQQFGILMGFLLINALHRTPHMKRRMPPGSPGVERKSAS
jgi:hypothetical protein